MSDQDLKHSVAGAVKWNVIDRLSSQVLYAVTGIVLARSLSPDDFGLVGAILVFQAFGALLIESGFSQALLQRREPTREDYSTVLWFNMGASVILYGVLFFAAPWIARVFGNDLRLVAMSRVMFLTLIINASAIVQTNILLKRMKPKMIAVSNSAGLVVSAVVGIYMALNGWGAWAIVWQAITLNVVKSLILWLTGKWTPLWRFSWQILRGFFKVGAGVMATSLLNTVFLNIYAVIIGARVGLTGLGYYTQADKWSKMGISSISQVLTSSFVPALSTAQDDGEAFASMTAKMTRTTAYFLFPALGLLAVMASAIFHVLFGSKWDPSIILFQLLLARGVFTVLCGLYGNFMLAKARTGLMLGMEILRDSVALIAIVITLPWLGDTMHDNPTWGLIVLLWGQLAASAITWIVSVVYTARICGRTIWQNIADLLPYAAQTAVAMGVCWAVGLTLSNPWAVLAAQVPAGAGVYLLTNYLLKSKVQCDVLKMIGRRQSA